MKKEIKRQIREDEFVSGVEHGWGWLSQHGEQLKLGGLALVLVLGGALAFSYFQNKRTREAESALGEALEIYQAPVTADLPAGSPAPQGRSYKSAREKYAEAATRFEGLASRHGSLPQGRRAALYAAFCRQELGEAEAARKGFEGLLAKSDAALADQAKLGLAQLDAGSGAVDKAVERLRQLADDPRSSVPRDFVLMTLAGTLERARRAAEAEQAYERVSQEFPESVYAGEARRRADYLKPEGNS